MRERAYHSFLFIQRKHKPSVPTAEHPLKVGEPRVSAAKRAYIAMVDKV